MTPTPAEQYAMSFARSRKYGIKTLILHSSKLEFSDISNNPVRIVTRNRREILHVRETRQAIPMNAVNVLAISI
jgi:hypothetical protein